MIPRRRREFQGGEQFSFASSRNTAQSHGKSGDDLQMEYDTWAERIKGRNGYFGKSDDRKPGAWTRRAGAFDYDEKDFRWLVSKEGEDSGTPSPPLWKDAGSPISKSAGNSPVSRAQQIEKFRQEMLEMVRDMPENGYELSLRDIVESPSPRVARTEEQRLVKVSEKTVKAMEEKAEKKDRKARSEGVRRMSRTDSMEAGGGLLIKMVVPPVSVGGGGARRKKTDSIGVSTSAKVSPRPSYTEAERSGGYSTDGEWWKKNELGGSGSSSSGSSNSSKSSTMNRIRKMTGCYSFLLRSKAREA